MTAKYHHLREEIRGHVIAGTLTEHGPNRWAIEFEVVKDGRIIAPLRSDQSRTYLSYSDACDAIRRKAEKLIDP